MIVRRSQLTGLIAAFALTTAIGTAGTARADVDAEVVGNAKIRGTLAPEGEIEVLRFDATAGSALTLGIVARKKAPLDFALTLFAPDGSEIPFDTAAKVIDKDKKVAVKKLPLTQSGSYRLEITATGIGEYALKLKAAPAKKLTSTIELTAGASGAAGIAAPAGSTVTIRATAPKGEVAIPRVDAVGGIDVTGQAGPKGSKHKVTVVLGDDDGGDLTIDLTNTAGDAGTVSIQTTVKPPKVKVVKLDVRGLTRGSPTGGETVVVRAVGTAGGVVGVDDGDSRIDGVQVAIPAGALLDPAAISIATSERIAVPDSDAQQSAGEAVEFGPDGLEFAVDATVVLPFDASALPIDSDPENDIRVVRQTGSGETEIITPTSVDVDAGTVTVPVSGFSTFMTIVPRGTPNLEGAEYWFLGFSIGLSPDPQGGFDSRARDIDLTLGSIALGERGVPDGVDVFAESRSVTWTHDQDGVGTFPVMDSRTDSDTGTWNYVPGGQAVEIEIGEEGGPDPLLVSEDGAFLLGGGARDVESGAVALDIGVRRGAPQTLASLAGRYYLGAFEFAAPGPAGFGPLEVSFSRAFATFTLDADGTWSLQGAEHVLDFVPGNGFRVEGESLRETGTARVGSDDDGLFENALIFETDQKGDDEIDSFVALPGEGGRVMLGADLEPLGDGQFFFILVRQSVGASKAMLNGEYGTISLEVEPTMYETVAQSNERIEIGDFATCVYDTLLDFDGSGNATELFYTGVCYERNEGEPGGISTEESAGADDEDSFAVKVAGDGKVTVPDRQPATGAVVRDGTFFFALEDPRNATRFYDVVVGIRPPPFVDEQP